MDKAASLSCLEINSINTWEETAESGKSSEGKESVVLREKRDERKSSRPMSCYTPSLPTLEPQHAASKSDGKSEITESLDPFRLCPPPPSTFVMHPPPYVKIWHGLRLGVANNMHPLGAPAGVGGGGGGAQPENIQIFLKIKFQRFKLLQFCCDI